MKEEAEKYLKFANDGTYLEQLQKKKLEESKEGDNDEGDNSEDDESDDEPEVNKKVKTENDAMKELEGAKKDNQVEKIQNNQEENK